MDRHAWELPGAHEEAPGVYRIPLPLPGDHLKAVNVYAITDGDELVLIDAGRGTIRGGDDADNGRPLCLLCHDSTSGFSIASGRI